MKDSRSIETEVELNSIPTKK